MQAQGVDLKLWDPLPEFVDGTQHIDMWMQIIGDNSVIGAGSVVTKDVPANVVAAGNPCKVLRPMTAQELEGVIQR